MNQDMKWYKKPLWIFIFLIFFFPLGLFLMWKYSGWTPKAKWIVTGILALFLIIGASGNDDSAPAPKVDSQPISEANLSPSNAPTASPASQLVENLETSTQSHESNSNNNSYLVTRVIDGDTIEIEGGQRIRYIGIDTPETVDPNRPAGCYGQEASDKNKALVLNKRVKLEKDVSETDKYGRLLRYVYVDDIMVNDYLVRQGFANASSYPPDIKYQEQFLQAQQEAVANSLGLWGTCQLNKTTTQANPTPPTTQATQNSGSCTIKGNISSDGEKIYHLPGCQSYNKTKIDTSAGERWFCSEEEAVQAGWRKAKNC